MVLLSAAAAALITLLWVVAYWYRRKLARTPVQWIELIARVWVGFLSLTVILLVVLYSAFS
jgi:hypothetical protein